MAGIDSVVQTPTVRRLCTFGHPLLALLKVVYKDDLRKQSQQKGCIPLLQLEFGGKSCDWIVFFVSYPIIILKDLVS